MESEIKPSLARKNRIIDTIIVLLIIAFFVSFNLTVHPAVVAGNSMQPTFETGDVLKTSRVEDDTEIARGDIVVFNHENKQYIKRVIGLPGESICIRNGQIYVGVNDSFELSGYEYDAITDQGILENEYIYQIPVNCYFCVGDNRNNSNDCRAFGAVPRSIITKIVIKKII